MRNVDDPTDFVPALTGRQDEIGQVAHALQAMMQRIAEERRQVGRHALEAQEQERTRVGRELHDEVGQDLTVLMLEAVSLSRSADPPTAEGLERLIEQMRTVVDEVRTISARLRPGALDDLGLKGAVQALVNDFQRQGHIRIGLAWDVLPPLDAEQELVCYRVAQEALTNVVRHAGATRADLSVAMEGGRLILTIRDDGRGITAEPRSGIEGMRERARLVHGQLDVAGDDGGTRVRLTIPLTDEARR
jgi:two-component system sensor histidine kinase UhpB